VLGSEGRDREHCRTCRSGGHPGCRLMDGVTQGALLSGLAGISDSLQRWCRERHRCARPTHRHG
jgi:hypothetical protein